MYFEIFRFPDCRETEIRAVRPTDLDCLSVKIIKVKINTETSPCKNSIKIYVAARTNRSFRYYRTRYQLPSRGWYKTVSHVQPRARNIFHFRF